MSTRWSRRTAPCAFAPRSRSSTTSRSRARSPRPYERDTGARMIDTVLQQAAEGFPRHLARLCGHIRQSSVSTDRPAIDAILGRLVHEIQALGGQAQIIPTAELPV